MPRGKRTLSIHFTELCNNRCIFCVVGAPEAAGELDDVAVGRLRAAVVAGRDQGCEVVNIHGGEPTVSPRFLGMLEFIHACGYPEVHLQTNGRKLADLAFARRLRELNVKVFIISMHGRTAATHDGLTGGPGRFAQAVQGIVNAKALGGRVQTNTVVTRQNLAELGDMVEWLAGLGVDCVNISNLHPAGTALLNFEAVTPTVAELQRWVPPALARAAGGKAAVTIEGFPHCFLPGLEAHHLARQYGTISVEIRGFWIPDYEQWMDASQKVQDEACAECAAATACGGVYRDYVERRGWAEIRGCCRGLDRAPAALAPCAP